jgi:hypothetical protein
MLRHKILTREEYDRRETVRIRRSDSREALILRDLRDGRLIDDDEDFDSNYRFSSTGNSVLSDR